MSQKTTKTYKKPSSLWQSLLLMGRLSLISLWLMGSCVTTSHAVVEEVEELVAAGLNDSTNDDSSAEANSNDSSSNSTSDPNSNSSNQIETSPAPQKDNNIRQRISGIFSEIDGLQAIHVTVNQGVVTLSGEVPNEKKAQQAINLTNRLSDVVTVEDNISRTLDVQDNVSSVYNGLKTHSKNLIKAAPLLLIAIVIFALVAWFGAWLSRRDSLWQRLTPNPFVAELLSQTIKVIFIILGLILGLSLMGAEAIIGTLLGGAGVIGIAVGFAVKDTIENYISSLMLSIRQPFRARDQVVINDHEGIVVRLTSRATILMTLDGNQLRIPNSEVFKATILNYTKNPERRFTFELGIDGNDDPMAAIKVGLDAINGLEFVLDKPKASANITQVGDSNIVLSFQVWVDQSQTDFSKARSIAIRETKHALENQGFSLPEPIYRLRFQPEIEQALQQVASSSQHSPTTQRLLEQDYKEQAKQRAKQVLQNADTSEILDARPDSKLMEKVEAEIAESAEADLLDTNSPQE